MFGLTLVDHLRMTFGHVIYTHRVHSQLAARYAQWNRWSMAAEALLVLAAALSSIALVATPQPVLAYVSAVSASLAACVVALRLVLDLDGRASMHRTCGARLWYIREQFRALLADLKDGHLTLDAARLERDGLMSRLQAIYDAAPPADRKLYEAAKSAAPNLHEDAILDEEVDRFLPPSLQKGGQSAA
jgi:hypothetical protein